jgi:hypothetical protein
LGASDHLVSSKGELCAYRRAGNGKLHAYGTDTLYAAAFVNGLKQEEDLQGVYYAPGVYARLPSLLESEG